MYVVSYSVVYLTYVGDQCYYIDLNQMKREQTKEEEQARKPQSYVSRNYDPPTHSLTGVKCRATSVAKKEVVNLRRGALVFVVGLTLALVHCVSMHISHH